MNTSYFSGTRLIHGMLLASLLGALAACNKAPPPAADALPPPPPPAMPAAQEPMPAPEPAPAPAPAPVEPKKSMHHTVHHYSTDSHSTDSAIASTGSEVPAPPRTPITVCSNCGVIESITPVKEEGKSTALGAVAGGLAGLVVGNQIGGGNGKTVAKIAGAAGGAYLGNKVEKKVRGTTHYDIKVRLDNGTETTISQINAPTLAVGAPVQIVSGTVVAK
ncbi:MAG: glycine zipper 2TM domain-containing protein [Steroidobacteraceae bacterium]